MLGSKLQLKKEVNRPGISVKLMFFLPLKTSTVTFRTVLDELLCFLSCPEFDILPIYIFFWNLSSLLFGEICPKNSKKSAVFSVNLSLQIPQNLTFFPVNYQKPWIIKELFLIYSINSKNLLWRTCCQHCIYSFSGIGSIERTLIITQLQKLIMFIKVTYHLLGISWPSLLNPCGEFPEAFEPDGSNCLDPYSHSELGVWTSLFQFELSHQSHLQQYM